MEGIKKHEMYVDGRYVDTKIFKLLREDWVNKKQE